MKEYKINFYNTTNLKSYDLNESMRYQLAVLDSLDVFTRLHSENVASITCRICEYLHLKNYFTIYCTICAYLHDIGKQFIPSSILQKNGPLTDEEYEKMKTHTTIGYEICMRDEKLRPYSAGPLYHHEALNGSGYPNGLAYPNIPLVGQIIRIADEFDAITSKRQYKSHVGVCETLNILISETVPIKKSLERATFNELTGENELSRNKCAKFGKVHPKILRALIKVVIDDTEYEIYNLNLYVEYLKEEIKRLDEIKNYQYKMENAHTDTNKQYYANGITQLLKAGETIENYLQVQEEYKQAYTVRKQNLKELNNELKEIKKLRV